jgi:hypothetical protein
MVARRPSLLHSVHMDARSAFTDLGAVRTMLTSWGAALHGIYHMSWHNILHSSSYQLHTQP